MAKHMTLEQLTAQAVPEARLMSRRDKIRRWAKLVKTADHTIHMFHGIEYWKPEQRDAAQAPGSAFDVAFKDPILRDAGLSGATLGDARRFFELSDADIHEFTCNCGGQLDNKDMAYRIDRMAAPTATDVKMACGSFAIGAILMGIAIGIQNYMI